MIYYANDFKQYTVQTGHDIVLCRLKQKRKKMENSFEETENQEVEVGPPEHYEAVQVPHLSKTDEVQLYFGILLLLALLFKITEIFKN